MHAFNSEGKVLNAGRLAQGDWQQAFAIADVEQQGGGDSAVWVLDDGGGYWLLRASTRERENVSFDRLPPAVQRLVVI
jgi:hypothetical protein